MTWELDHDTRHHGLEHNPHSLNRWDIAGLAAAATLGLAVAAAAWLRQRVRPSRPDPIDQLADLLPHPVTYSHVTGLWSTKTPGGQVVHNRYRNRLILSVAPITTGTRRP